MRNMKNTKELLAHTKNTHEELMEKNTLQKKQELGHSRTERNKG